MNFKALLTVCAAVALCVTALAKDIELLNVSYDPTRELYAEYNVAFASYWKAKTGDTVAIKQSHGGSGKQARSVIDGLRADVVTLALANDVNMLQKVGNLIPADWQSRLPFGSAPYTSTIVFVVRKSSPFYGKIKDWADLAQPGVKVITPNPKTSGGAQWNYLAAWEYGRRHFGSDAKAQEFVAGVYSNVPVLDSGARGSTTTFVQRGIGDVLISWENEAYLVVDEFGTDKFEIVVPSLSILAQPTVCLVDKVAKRKGTTEVAQAYLEYLYSDAAQELIVKHHYRPATETAKTKYDALFPKLELFTIDDAFGGWPNAAAKHFANQGTFDQIYLKISLTK
jgi:sulfate/thiosulfate transport system substrate-binding protein